MKKGFLPFFLVFALIISFTITNNAYAAQAANTAPSLLPPKELQGKLDDLVLSGIITVEQAEKARAELAGGNTPEHNNYLANLISNGIINEAQALAIENAAFKDLPEGVPEMPETNAVFSLKGKEITKAGQKYIGSRQNESGIKAYKKGILNLIHATIETTGSASFNSCGCFFGLSAGVLAEADGTIHMTDSTIKTAGDGAAAVFATGSSVITLNNIKIETTGDSSYGIAATAKGSITTENTDISTLGNYSPAISADRVNGAVYSNGGNFKTAGKDAPGVYSAGNVIITKASISAAQSEAVTIDGRNSVTLNDTVISGAKPWGVLLFQSYTGRLESGLSRFTMNGGSLTAGAGPAFYVTNTEGQIELTDAAISAPAKKLLEVAAGKWGNKGMNGGKLNFTATRENLAGSIFCDNISSLNIYLKDHTTLTSTINDVRTAGSVNVVLDSTSVWNVTGTSYLSSLTDADTTFANIQDNGFTIYYDARLAANQWLGSKTYPLKSGGKLMPNI